jgi:hypothetical protein
MSEIWKTVRISEKTYKALAHQGDLSETFDFVIAKLIANQQTQKEQIEGVEDQN